MFLVDVYYRNEKLQISSMIEKNSLLHKTSHIKVPVPTTFTEIIQIKPPGNNVSDVPGRFADYIGKLNWSRQTRARVVDCTINQKPTSFTNDR